MEKIRLLQADEIECRVQAVKPSGCSVLLYKTARVDMSILDEMFGPMNWKRTHELIGDRLYCNIDVWDNDKKEWVRKQDVGTESNTEAEKGQASDAFKRAGFNIGIGRELYTAPFIWISITPAEYNGGKLKVSFSLKEIEYDDKRNISRLVIVDDKGSVRYTYPRQQHRQAASPAPAVDDLPSGEPEQNVTGYTPDNIWEKLGAISSVPELGEFYNTIFGGNASAPAWVKTAVSKRMKQINATPNA